MQVSSEHPDHESREGAHRTLLNASFGRQVISGEDDHGGGTGSASAKKPAHQAEMMRALPSSQSCHGPCHGPRQRKDAWRPLRRCCGPRLVAHGIHLSRLSFALAGTGPVPGLRGQVVFHRSWALRGDEEVGDEPGSSRNSHICVCQGGRGCSRLPSPSSRRPFQVAVALGRGSALLWRPCRDLSPSSRLGWRCRHRLWAQRPKLPSTRTERREATTDSRRLASRHSHKHRRLSSGPADFMESCFRCHTAQQLEPQVQGQDKRFGFQKLPGCESSFVACSYWLRSCILAFACPGRRERRGARFGCQQPPRQGS